MTVRELAIPGAWEITPQQHADDRGVFYEWFSDPEFGEFSGHRFDLRQANCSVSAAGVLRGLHFAQLPPSQAKYVTCLRGAVFDVVVDIRVGSPTFGQWDSVLLDDREPPRRCTSARAWRTVSLPCRMIRLSMYLCSTGYNPTREHTIRATDPALDIHWPSTQHVLSDRDADAPTLDEVKAAGLLPTWDDAKAFVEELRRRDS